MFMYNLQMAEYNAILVLALAYPIQSESAALRIAGIFCSRSKMYVLCSFCGIVDKSCQSKAHTSFASAILIIKCTPVK
jgi:hypothetical protein